MEDRQKNDGQKAGEEESRIGENFGTRYGRYANFLSEWSSLRLVKRIHQFAIKVRMAAAQVISNFRY